MYLEERGRGVGVASGEERSFKGQTSPHPDGRSLTLHKMKE